MVPTCGPRVPWQLSFSGRTTWGEAEQHFTSKPGQGQLDQLTEDAERAVRAAGPGYAAVGALPFDEVRARADLRLARLHTATSSTVVLRPTGGALGGSLPSASPSGPHPELPYREAVHQALQSIASGFVEKVVLARSVSLGHPVEPQHVIASLNRLYPHAYVFASWASHTDDALLVGASPELLLARSGDRLVLNPLAGTTLRHHDPRADQERARDLLASTKDRMEHQFVVDDLRTKLAPLCSKLDIPAQPTVRAAGHLWHLSSTIRARLRVPAPSALRLATMLHPTPAVCGVPTNRALQLIRKLEPKDRGCYSGLVGWVDAVGDGIWVLALRCAETSSSDTKIFAGAGVTAQSDPDAEFSETEAKLGTMLAVLGPQGLLGHSP